jgi:hypothetical protein
MAEFSAKWLKTSPQSSKVADKRPKNLSYHVIEEISSGVQFFQCFLINKANNMLKGQCHEIFDPRFFSSHNPDSRAKAVLHMAPYSPRKSLQSSDPAFSIETAGSDSVVSMRSQDRFLRFQWECRIGSRGFNETAGIGSSGLIEIKGSDLKIFVKKFYSLNEIHCLLEGAGSDPRSQWDLGIESRGVYETAGFNPPVSMRWQDRIPQFQRDRRIGSFVLNETAEIFLTLRESSPKQILALIPFKGKP